MVGRVTTSIPAERVTELSARMSELMPGVRADLEALSRIPSVSLSSFDPAHVRTSAEATAELLRGEGMQVELVDEAGLSHSSSSPGGCTSWWA